MDDSPVPIQVVFQGGGAKLCDLLAAAEAIEGLEKAGEIVIRRVAGTSAGAIAACLLASGQSIESVRERLRATGNRHLSRINTKLGFWRAGWRIASL